MMSTISMYMCGLSKQLSLAARGVITPLCACNSAPGQPALRQRRLPQAGGERRPRRGRPTRPVIRVCCNPRAQRYHGYGACRLRDLRPDLAAADWCQAHVREGGERLKNMVHRPPVHEFATSVAAPVTIWRAFTSGL